MLLTKNTNPYSPCGCESGKKYKFCCKSRAPSPENLSKFKKESFTITIEALTNEETQYNWDVVLPEDQFFLDKLCLELKDPSEKFDSEDHQLIFDRLNVLLEKYPNNPIILNRLTTLYLYKGNHYKMKETIVETHVKFPTYLFALTSLATLYAFSYNRSEFLDLFKGARSLKQLYPHREVFHVEEVKAFHGTFLNYHCLQGEVQQAKSHFSLLENIMIQFDTEDDYDFIGYKNKFLELLEASQP